MTDELITANMTVREVMTRYPGAERIFNKYGLIGCGGPRGPVEPIAWFARAHEVDPEALLAELNHFVRSGEAEIGPRPPAEEPPELYPRFMWAAIVIALTVGCTLGATNLSMIALRRSFDFPDLWWWTAHVQVHGHAQVIGWVGLFIMGVAYHVLPHLKATPLVAPRLAGATLWMVLAGLLAHTIGQPYVGRAAWAGAVFVGGGALELAGISAFAYIAARTLTSGQPPALYERFLWAGVAWFWAQAAATVLISVHMVGIGVESVPEALNRPHLHMQLWGFIAFFILGVSLRTLPVFMGLREPNQAAVRFGLWALSAGVALNAGWQFVGAALPGAPWRTGAAVGAMLEFAAILAFVFGLNVLRRPAYDISEAGVPRGYEKFVRVAYAWLVAAIAMTSGYSLYQAATGDSVSHALMGAYRHAITVGFVTMMILGMASRMVPVFRGVPLYSQGLLNGTFALVNFGNLLRVGFQAAIPILGGVSFAMMGVSGWLEVSALALFAINIGATMTRRPEETPLAAEEELEIGPRTRVGDLLARHPQTLEVFLRHGFAQLRNPVLRATVARRVTIEQACRIHPTDLQALLAELRAAAGGVCAPTQEVTTDG